MNEINFNIEDVEKIDLSLDFGVKELTPPLEDLEVTPSAEEQVFTHEGSYGYDKVTVHPKGGSDPNDFFWMDETIGGGSSTSYPIGWLKFVKILPPFKNSGTSCERLFRFCGAKEIDTSLLDTSACTNMNEMFIYCNNLKNLDVSHFDTSNVTNMSGLFRDCMKLQNVDMSKWNTAKVTNFSNMFYNCEGMTEIDLSNFDFSGISKSTSTTGGLYYMFCSCDNVEKITFPNTDVKYSAGATMDTMFSTNSKLKEIDLSCFDTSLVKSFNATFSACKQLTKLDLSTINMSSAYIFYGTFRGCENLKEIKFSNIPCALTSSGRIQEMFEECYALESVDLSWMSNTTSINASEMFNKCRSLKFIDIRNLELTLITSSSNYRDMFRDVPADCEIIVKDDANKQWVLKQRSDFTNVKTVAELG